MNAPEPQLKALLEVAYWAILDARATAAMAVDKDPVSQKAALERVVALMNVAHNIPHGIINYEKWDEGLLRMFLRRHDEKWASGGEVSLTQAYERTLSKF